MKLALFLHLIGFALGFGTVILVDITGLLWALGRATAVQVTWLTGIAQRIIWSALVIQIGTGLLLLEPDHITLNTKIKLVAVLLLLLNGIALDRIRKQLMTYKLNSFWELPRRFQLVSVASLSLSQLGWWTATIIGFLTANSH